MIGPEGFQTNGMPAEFGPPGRNYPIDHVCPACHAQPGKPCSAPTVEGRRAVSWVHNARRDLAEGWV
jgi:hypothetical protein